MKHEKPEIVPWSAVADMIQGASFKEGGGS
jgi:hypothetical protein